MKLYYFAINVIADILILGFLAMIIRELVKVGAI